MSGQIHDTNTITKMDSINEYAKIIVKDINELVKTYNVTYRTDTEIYKNNYIVKIIVDKSQSSVIKPDDTAMAITPNITEENVGLLWKRKKHRLHLNIRTYMDKFPGLRIEAIRALFTLYKYKLIAGLRMHELKDADSKVEFIFT